MKMKYCPYCGTELTTEDLIYCAECGKDLTLTQQKRESPVCRKQNLRSNQISSEKYEYDGYYDDVPPEDANSQRERVDKRLVKRIVMLTLMVVIVIAGCVAALYLL